MSTLELTLGAVGRYARRLDRTVLATLVVVAAVAAFAPTQVVPTLRLTADSVLAIAPVLALSVAVAAYLGAAGADKMIGHALRGNAATAIVTAALFGALSPFCSCGVIPLIAAALAAGVPLPAVMAFWLSSPLMAPDMFLITAAALGPAFAGAKTATAIGLGLLGGFATLAMQRWGAFPAPLREGVSGCGCAGRPVREPSRPVWGVWREPERRRALLTKALDNAAFLGKWLVFAFVLESLMVAWIPAETIAAWLGTDSLWSLPLAVAVGIPAYLNGYAAVPVMAGLVEQGMSAGAALAFMTAGGVTSIPAAIAVFALVRRPVFGWYIVLALVGSLTAGGLYRFAAG